MTEGADVREGYAPITPLSKQVLLETGLSA
jgi:hypothetical protein